MVNEDGDECDYLRVGWEEVACAEEKVKFAFLGMDLIDERVEFLEFTVDVAYHYAIWKNISLLLVKYILSFEGLTSIRLNNTILMIPLVIIIYLSIC